MIHGDEDFDDELMDLILDYHEENIETYTQLLGNPHLLHGDIFLPSQLVSNGLNCCDETFYDEPKAKELEPGVKDWVLLFQLDSEDNANMKWSNLGILCFTIKKKRFKKSQF